MSLQLAVKLKQMDKEILDLKKRVKELESKPKMGRPKKVSRETLNNNVEYEI